MGLTFPIEFDKCPNCGGDKKVAQSVIDGLIEDGLAGEGLKGFAIVSPTVQGDPKRRQLLLTVLTCFIDVCADCGTLYCVRADLRKMSPEQGGQKPPQIFRGFG